MANRKNNASETKNGKEYQKEGYGVREKDRN